MQCKDCTHQVVCMHKNEFDKLEQQLPVTSYPFKSSVTCGCYLKQAEQVRNDLYNQAVRQKFLGE